MEKKQYKEQTRKNPFDIESHDDPKNNFCKFMKGCHLLVSVTGIIALSQHSNKLFCLYIDNSCCRIWFS